MAKKQLEVVASLYKSEEGAKTMFDTLEKMHKASNITIEDSAVVTKDAEGKLQIKETREVTTREGVTRGALVAGALAIIYPPSLLGSLLAGGAVGGAIGKLRDTGIKTDYLKEVGDALQPGNAAVVVLTETGYVPKIVETMEAYDVEFIRHPGADA